MIAFVGAGPGATDLITLRGARLLASCDCLIYAGSLVNPDFLKEVKASCRVYDSASMTLDEVVAVLIESQARGELAVRLHTGEPSLYGAIREQMALLDERGLAYEVVPGVSSFAAAAATLKKEFTLPGISQSLIITRRAGRTPVPEREALPAMAAHGTSMVLFLSVGQIAALCEDLLAGGAYRPETPAAVVYRASWPDEQIVKADLAHLPAAVEAAGITRQALVLVGDFLREGEDYYERSKLYAPDFTHGYREAKVKEGQDV